MPVDTASIALFEELNVELLKHTKASVELPPSEANEAPTIERSDMTAKELCDWLERWNLNDANAAKIFGVVPWTIKKWTRDGVGGPAVVVVKLLNELGIDPNAAANMLGVSLTNIGRRGYRV